MKPRISSILVGLAWVLFGLAACRVVSKFAVIFRDLYGADMPLPRLTRVVLAVSPAGWLLGSLAIAAFIVVKDRSGFGRRIPNDVFLLVMLIVAAVAVVALFRALMIVDLKALP
jgi:hypothetical protein